MDVKCSVSFSKVSVLAYSLSCIIPFKAFFMFNLRLLGFLLFKDSESWGEATFCLIYIGLSYVQLGTGKNTISHRGFHCPVFHSLVPISFRIWLLAIIICGYNLAVSGCIPLIFLIYCQTLRKQWYKPWAHPALHTLVRAMGEESQTQVLAPLPVHSQLCWLQVLSLASDIQPTVTSRSLALKEQ